MRGAASYLPTALSQVNKGIMWEGGSLQPAVSRNPRRGDLPRSTRPGLKRMNWKNDRIKCGPDVSGLDNKMNDGALYLERVWVWRNLT